MRKLAWFAGAFSAAVFLAVYLLPEGLLLPAGLACALAALLGLLLRGDRRRRMMLACLGLAAGLAWTGTYGQLTHAPAQALAGTEGTISATAADWPRETAYGSSVLVYLRPEEGLPISTRLYLDDPSPDLRPGDTLTVPAELRLADTIAGEHTDYYYAKGILLVAYGEGEAEVSRPASPPWWTWPAYAARALEDSVARAFPDWAAPLITALITGEDSGMDGGEYAALRRTGLSHVISVSGLHVSFLAGCLAALLGAWRRRTAVISIALMFFFAAAVGNTPAVLRAAFMQSMLLLAPLVGREDDRATSLFTILMLLLAANPYAAASVSLQLSFAAVAGIYLFTGPLNDRLRALLPSEPKGFWPRLGRLAGEFVFASLSTTLGAIVFTTPLTAVYFHSVSLIAPLANLLTLWAFSLAFLGGLAVSLAGLALPALAGVLAWPVSLAVWFVQKVTAALARLPFASVSTQSVYLRLWLALVYGLLLLYLLWRGEKKRPLVPIGLGTAALCGALVLNAAAQTGGALTVSVLDVGQGLSVALTSGGRTALVDCGGTGSADPGDVAADYVQDLGLSRIDLVVLTHYHQDHAGGVPELLNRLDVGLLVLPDVEADDPLRAEITALAAEQGVETLFVSENTGVALGAAALTISGPLGTGGGNEEGLSILCTAGEFDALITGDMNSAVEHRLVKYGNLPDIELLVAGHHGSKYSTSEELLLETKPETAVISTGYNTYGHPAPETLERLAAAGCDIYRTDWSGTVTVTAQP